ncbi:MAG: MBL fold metallo-hydrolase [Gammaproteobacteria bacterium]|nr:MBL fold metallo-hydrolase [Gammaproteobacteria bacterium]
MRFASLGSGSRGNATLVQQGDTCLLIDCGFSARETEHRLARLELSPEQLTAVLVTHEHGDHINGVGPLARKYRLPVWATGGTFSANRLGDGVRGKTQVHRICSHSAFAIDDIEIQPFPVPHDAREPCQFVFGNGDKRLGLLTDVGSRTPHIKAQLSGCEALILECNHDREMLANGEYPVSLKRRVAGDHGHLSNRQAADILRDLDSSKLTQLVAAHLSEKHNTPTLAQTTLAEVMGCDADWVAVADQQTGLDWRDV